MLADQTIHFSIALGLLMGNALNYLPPPFYIAAMTIISIAFFNEMKPFKRICPAITALIFLLLVGLILLIGLRLAEFLLIDIRKYEILFRTIRIGILIFYLYFMINFLSKNKTKIMQ